MSSSVATYQANLEAVNEMVSAACQRVGRKRDEVRVICVTKYVGPEAIADLLAAGMRDFGENRWQQAAPKLQLPEAKEASWHFIGHLQSNKAKQIASRFDWVHSIDSLSVAAAVSKSAVQFQRQVRCLVQVNISGEDSKSGVAPDEAANLIERMSMLEGIQVCGLMTMAPLSEDAEEARQVFRGLAALQESLRQQLGLTALQELSMGMSNDFTVAIEEGATMVRVGRRLLS